MVSSERVQRVTLAVYVLGRYGSLRYGEPHKAPVHLKELYPHPKLLPQTSLRLLLVAVPQGPSSPVDDIVCSLTVESTNVLDVVVVASQVHVYPVLVEEWGEVVVHGLADRAIVSTAVHRTVTNHNLPVGVGLG